MIKIGQIWLIPLNNEEIKLIIHKPCLNADYDPNYLGWHCLRPDGSSIDVATRWIESHGRLLVY